MCGMPVCEWTQREPTLDIRFMGEDYDPGRSGRNREKDSKAKANGTDERRREKAGRMEQMPRNEMRCLISPGQARSYPWSVWSDVEPLKAPPAAQGIHYSHTYWKRRNTLESMYLFVTPLSARSTSPSYKNLSVLCRFFENILLQHKPTLFVQKFPWETLGLTRSLCCLFKCPLVFLFFYSNRCTWQSETVSACRRKIRSSEMKTSLLGGNCMWLYLRLVYLRVFDPDSVRLRLIPGVLWQFAGWQKALQCLKLDQRKEGLKSRRPAGRRSEETQTLARAIVRYTVAAGSRNFSLCVCVFFFFSYGYLLPLLSSSQKLNGSVKGLRGFIWFRQNKSPCICSLFQLSLKV